MMDPLFIQSLLRNGLQMLGGTLMASGYFTGEQWTAVTGGVLALVSVGLSMWNAKKTVKIVEVAKAEEAKK